MTDIGALPLGEHRIVVTRVTNYGRGPASVLGVAESCGVGACYEPVDAGPVVVPPGGSVDIACMVTLREAGPVRFEVQLYLDNGKFDHVSVQVNGITLPSQGGTDGAQQSRQ